MLRRTFLKVATAAGSINIEPDAADFDDVASEDGSPWYASVAGTLPTAAALGGPSQYAVSLTQLGGATTVTDDVLTGAAVCGTVFAGRTAVDVAFDATETTRLRERLRTAAAVDVDARGGWTIGGRRHRHRYRVVAVDDSTAIVGVGPVSDRVRAVVDTTIQSLDHDDDRPERRSAPEDWEQLFSHLGTGRHVSVDTTPDHTPDSVVATGERYRHTDSGATIRHVTLFDTVRAARRSDLDDLGASRRLETTSETASRVTRRGHALIQDAAFQSDSPAYPG